MDLDTVNFPAGLARGAQFKRRTSTQIVVFESGAEQTAQLRAQQLWAYECGLVTMTTARAVEAATSYNNFIDALSGPADVFRFEDPRRDRSTLTAANGVLQPYMGGAFAGDPGFGYGTPTAQIQRKAVYGDAAGYKDIQKPRAATVAISRAGSPLTVTTHYSVDGSRGVVTFVADESKAITAITPGSSTEITVGTAFSAPALANGDRIYVTGVAGSAADVLNGLSHEITNIASNVYTLDVDTTDLTATGGTAATYPQPDEALVVTCRHDIACRLELDEITEILLGRNPSTTLQELPSIPLVEFRFRYP